ncbi:MAG TPA: diaminopimelate epimerase [bacterium]|nr:diaminopimelate epimerase [bacterium]
MSFTKMHGTGNDFIILNGISQTLPPYLGQLSKKICDRRFGIGADQVLVVQPSTAADFKMLIFNADGGEVEMCGNGIRCFAKYVRDQGLTQQTELVVETAAGLIKPEIVLDHPRTIPSTLWVKVDMGEPQSIHAKTSPAVVQLPPWNIEVPITVDQVPASWRSDDQRRFFINEISMGNPHCVIFVHDVEHYPVERVGPYFENHPRFPNRTNVEFVQIIDRNRIKQRTWERGVGETLACGTGACASVVASVLNNMTDKNVTVSLKGGDLEIKWSQRTGHVIKTGPATTVFEGEMIMGNG